MGKKRRKKKSKYRTFLEYMFASPSGYAYYLKMQRGRITARLDEVIPGNSFEEDREDYKLIYDEMVIGK